MVPISLYVCLQIEGFNITTSYIPIRMPPDRGIQYYNRKHFYSIVLQAVCREDLKTKDLIKCHVEVYCHNIM